MKLCPYCDKKISWFFGIDHTKCNADAEKHRSFLRNHTKNEALSGTFNLGVVGFSEAMEYLPSDEAHAAIAGGYHDAVEEMCDDLILDYGELEKLDSFVQHFAARMDKSFEDASEYLDRYETNKTIFQAQILFELKKGILPKDRQPPAGLMLNKNETFIYSWDSVQCSTLNVKTKFRGRSTGGSYRLAKNLTIRHTEHRGRPVSYSEWNSKGSGVLAVTNKHLFFLGDSDAGDVKERFSSVSSLDPTSDGFIVNLTLKTRPAVRFTLEGTSRYAWFASNIILAAPSL